MTLTSSRKAIGQGLVQMLQGITDPDTNQPLYQYVKLGSVFDVSQYSGLWAEVLPLSARSGPMSSGGNQVGWLIKDDSTWILNSGYIYDADSTAAMNAILHAADILLPVLHSHYQIPAPGNPSQPIASVYSLLEGEQNDQGRPVRFPNGKVYWLWSAYALVKQQYTVTLVNP